MSTLGLKETTISLLVCVPVNSAALGTHAALWDGCCVRRTTSVFASARGFYVTDPPQVGLHYKIKSFAALIVLHTSRYVGSLWGTLTTQKLYDMQELQLINDDRIKCWCLGTLAQWLKYLQCKCEHLSWIPSAHVKVDKVAHICYPSSSSVLQKHLQNLMGQWCCTQPEILSQTIEDWQKLACLYVLKLCIQMVI